MELENLASEVKEQKTPAVQLVDKEKEIDRRYDGQLSEGLMREAGERLKMLFSREGAQRAKQFHTWLHEETKRYLGGIGEYTNLLRIMDSTKYVHSGNRTNEQLLIEGFKQALFAGKYSSASRLAKGMVDSLVCYHSTHYLDVLMAHGKKKQAKGMAVALGRGLDIYLSVTYGFFIKPNKLYNKLNKAQRR